MSLVLPGEHRGHKEAEFDAFAANYDQALNEGLHFTGEGRDYFAQGRVQWLRKRLESCQTLPEHCLDFGCGIGSGCQPLIEGLGLQSYVGYDPSADSIHEARKAGKHESIRFESNEGVLAGAGNDLAFVNGVFHHIPQEERDQSIQLIWNSMKPGGWFAFWENNRWNPIVHFLMSRVPFDRDARMLFPHQARALLRRHGFEIVLTDYLFIFPALLKALRPLEAMLCKLPLGGQYLVLARKPARPIS